MKNIINPNVGLFLSLKVRYSSKKIIYMITNPIKFISPVIRAKTIDIIRKM